MRPLKFRFVALIAVSPFCTSPLTESDARATTGRQRNCASTYQRLPVTTRLCARLRLSARRGKIKFNAVGDASAPSCE